MLYWTCVCHAFTGDDLLSCTQNVSRDKEKEYDLDHVSLCHWRALNSAIWEVLHTTKREDREQKNMFMNHHSHKHSCQNPSAKVRFKVKPFFKILKHKTFIIVNYIFDPIPIPNLSHVWSWTMLVFICTLIQWASSSKATTIIWLMILFWWGSAQQKQQKGGSCQSWARCQQPSLWI